MTGKRGRPPGRYRRLYKYSLDILTADRIKAIAVTRGVYVSHIVEQALVAWLDIHDADYPDKLDRDVGWWIRERASFLLQERLKEEEDKDK